ncbi:rhodanese-like domain-containing protein [Cecembia calidifontis]|jgi:rhodanese-related sulfurtransferase|uniref:Rhodanese-related sulfurtransferase n=1 Tax=Cecembia calidifontis TaxID=1187080 RepID=A0A4Q7P9G8_9BACT|nr:rhodanese-like domain-containing protein [Cecembia calidifontis]RZS96218.1 rhodanese-related sulfurtransferase [Cecembia calidifontis]
MKTSVKNWKNVLFLMGFFISISLTQNAFAQEGAPKLSPDEFEVQAKKHKKKNVILDIRTPEEVAEGYIEGAKFVDFLGGNFETEIQKLDKKKTYYVYCRSARRTIPATEKMKELGFKKVYMLDGGLNNWIEKGKPLTKSPK